MEIIYGDFLEIEWWNEADIVYLANIVYGKELNRKLMELCTLMKTGSRVAVL